jgi:3-oxoacyl-[acyl-carrier-protein] synthase III
MIGASNAPAHDFASAKYARSPMEKVFVNVDRFGTMSSASVPVALDGARESALFPPGSLVLLAASEPASRGLPVW